ncbi:hypothetical protein EJB05_44626 [Eragrostis curvula]|uniref:Uncharacterized protein n=1 Tax=Eragrostis curvula TaxID=38414 RepID=A0A5J9TIE4_9POAL|nr:hypothetical protein EJB05_44626 [Eragrostis curvula]
MQSQMCLHAAVEDDDLPLPVLFHKPPWTRRATKEDNKQFLVKLKERIDCRLVTNYIMDSSLHRWMYLHPILFFFCSVECHILLCTDPTIQDLGHQTTKGIWIAKAVRIESFTVVLDMEGTNGRERLRRMDYIP